MLFSSKPILEPFVDETDDTISFLGAVPGTLAQDDEGNVYELTESALSSGAPSWKGGIIRVNHSVKETGLIDDAWYDNGLMLRVSGLSPDARAVMKSSAYRGVSQESLPLELGIIKDIKGHPVREVTKIKGTGISLIVYPETPACPLEAGCGVPIVSSTPDVFNSPLNTDSPKIDTEPQGGPSMDEIKPDINLEEIMKENDALRAQLTKLTELVEKQPEVIDKAVAGALASQAIKIKEEAEFATIAGELKSCMPEGFEELMATAPSKDTLKATIKAMRSLNPVGGVGGTIKSSIPEKFQSGYDIYSKLGVSVDDVAKYNGGV